MSGAISRLANEFVLQLIEKVCHANEFDSVGQSMRLLQ